MSHPTLRNQTRVWSTKTIQRIITTIVLDQAHSSTDPFCPRLQAAGGLQHRWVSDHLVRPVGFGTTEPPRVNPIPQSQEQRSAPDLLRTYFPSTLSECVRGGKEILIQALLLMNPLAFFCRHCSDAFQTGCQCGEKAECSSH